MAVVFTSLTLLRQCIRQTGSPVLSPGFYKALKTAGMDPGLEFKVALEEAEKLDARSERDTALPHALAFALATTASLSAQLPTALRQSLLACSVTTAFQPSFMTAGLHGMQDSVW